jgi:hypothetical protein
VSAEFGEGYAAPAEGADRTIAEQFAQRILTDKNLDVGFNPEPGRGWAQTPRAVETDAPGGAREAASIRATGLRQPPLPDPSTWAVSEEFLDEQGLKLIEPEGEALGEYLADLEEVVRVWWRSTTASDQPASPSGAAS